MHTFEWFLIFGSFCIGLRPLWFLFLSKNEILNYCSSIINFMDKLLKYNNYKSIITVFHNERENIKPRKKGVRNILWCIKNLKDIRCFLLCETTKLRLNFVHCFIQKISLSVLIRIGDLPSANVITELRWILKMQQVSYLFCP